MKATIMDMWEMELPDVSDNPWFLDWVARSPKHAGDHLKVSFRTFESLLNVYSPDAFDVVHEYFGGIGAHALMVRDLFSPALSHTVADYSPEAVEHMKRVLPPSVVPAVADAYAGGSIPPADLHIMDFGDLTVFKSQPGRERGDLLDRVFATEPLAVTITDIAARYLHLNRKHYEPYLGEGTCGSYEDYLEAYSRHLEDRYGYVMLEGNYTRWSCVMAFVPESLATRDSRQFHKLPATDKTPGLVLS